MTKRDEWIRVRSESELRAGMCVELRNCSKCGNRERLMVLRFNAIGVQCAQCGVETADVTAIGGCKPGHRPVCYRPAIAEGRLFRLSDSQLAEDETARELERVR